MKHFLYLLITLVLTQTVFSQDLLIKGEQISSTPITVQKEHGELIIEDDFSMMEASARTIPNSSEVGEVEGSFAVSPSGAATYSVPISAPIGIKDVMPNVSLTYNSQATNSIAGYGWSLSGISTITRIPATEYHDGFIDGVDFDKHDRYALDGQRLILKSGTYGEAGSEYVTEQYSNLKVRAVGTSPYGASYGPSYFIVNYPDGSIAHYGNVGSSRSRIEWSIGRWYNPQGLRVNYNYTSSGNLLRITSIKYGSRNSSGGINEIKFEYNNRNRKEQIYVGGVSFDREHILKAISTYTNNSLQRKYELNHNTTTLGYERLVSIQEKNSTGVSLSPLIFDYDNTKNRIKTHKSTGKKFFPGFSHKDYEIVGGEFNGDGRSDFLTYKKYDKTKIHVFTDVLGTYSDIGHQVNIGEFDHIVSGNILSSDNSILSGQAIIAINRKQASNSKLTTDVTFKTIAMNAYGGVLQYEKTWNAPAAYNQYTCGEIAYKEIPRQYISGDFNGDGLTEIIAINKQYTTNSCYRQYGCDPNNPVDPILIKQKTRRFPINNDCCKCTSNRTSYAQATFIDLNRFEDDFVHSIGALQNPVTGNDNIFAADVNGDGKVDLVHIRPNEIKVYTYSTQKKRLEFLFSTGNDTTINLNKPVLSGDFNGDGKLDFATPIAEDDTNWKFYNSTGISFHTDTIDLGVKYKKAHSGIFPFQNNAFNYQSWNEYQYIAQDFNGDGKTDILVHAIITPYSRHDESYEIFALLQNNGALNFEKIADKTIKNSGVSKFGLPMPVQANSKTHNPVYAYVSVNSIYGYEFTKNNTQETLLRKSTNSNGVELAVNYSNLARSSEIINHNVYETDYGAKYPYFNINVAPSLNVVTDITEASATQTRFRDYSYKGAVSHAKGLGFLGFKGFSQSNWHDNRGQLFTTTLFNPELRGVPVEQITDHYPNFNMRITGNYISYSENEYNFELLSNKVFKSNLSQTVSFDNLKQVQTIVDYEYDQYSSPTTVTTSYPDGYNKVEYTYRNNPTATGNTYCIGRPLDKKETRVLNGDIISKQELYTYSNNIVKTIQLKGHNTNAITKTMTHDSFGNILTLQTSAQGESTRNETFEYESTGRFLIRHKGIDGLTKAFEYHPNGLLKKETDVFGNSTEHYYDKWDRPILSIDYLGNEIEYDYYRSANQYIIGKSSPGSGWTFKVYDDLNRIIEERTAIPSSLANGNYIKKAYEYDVLDRVVRASEPYFTSPTLWSKTTYDEYGRLVTQQLPTGKIITTAYNGLTTTVDDSTKTVTTTIDTAGNIVSVTDPGGTVQYTYFADGNMKTANYGGHIVSIEQDGWGRKTKLNDPAAGVYTYAYNAWGQTTYESTPEGETTYNYDNNGRVSYKEIQGENTNEETYYYYNQLGQLKDILFSNFENNKDAELSYHYDDYGRVIKVHEGDNTFFYEKEITYDNVGRLNTTHYSSHVRETQEGNELTTQNVYAYGGVLQEVKDANTGQTLWKVNQLNERMQATSFTNGNNITTTTNYDQYGFPISIQNDDLFTLDYRFNTITGNLDERQNSLFNEDERFSYDNLDRLVNINTTYGVNQTKTYDNRGRITNDTDLGELLFDNSSTYKIASIDLNNKGFDYYNDRKLQQITYNANKKPLTIHEKDKGRVDFAYGAFGQRTDAWYGGEQEQKDQRQYHKRYSHDGTVEMITDRSGNTKFVTYIGGDGYSAPVVNISFRGNANGFNSGYYYLHRDYQGSILGISNNSGELVEQRHFGAWGDITHYNTTNVELEDLQEGNSNFALLDRGYTGHEHFFSVGLIHMNGRMYDAKLGRFLSPDNFIQDPYNTQNFNRFGYVLNNPLKFTDPSGEFIHIVIGAVIGGVINLAIKAIQGEIGSIGDGLAAFGIGAAAGAIGAATGGAALAAVGVGGAAGGAIAGAAGGLTGGFIQELGNSLYFARSSIGDALKSGLRGAAYGFVGGAVIGGAVGGISALAKGTNFWTGRNIAVGRSSFSLKNTPKYTAGNTDYSTSSGGLDRVINPETIAETLENADIFSSSKGVSKPKIDAYLEQMTSGNFDPKNGIAGFKDGSGWYVTDGHHRAIAATIHGMRTGNYYYLNSIINNGHFDASLFSPSKFSNFPTTWGWF